MRNSTLSRLALLGLASVSSVAFAASNMNGQVRFDARFTVNQEDKNSSSVADKYEKADNLHISRARLDFSGDVAKDWMYNIRLEYSENENDQIGVDPTVTAGIDQISFTSNSDLLKATSAVISRAYVCWAGVEGMNVKMGRIGTPEVTSDRLYYRPYIGKTPNDRTVGSVTNYSGDHPGFSVDGAAGPIGYSFGVWKQTDFRKIEVADSGAAFNLIVEGDDLTTDYIDSVVAKIDEGIPAAMFDSKSLRIGFGGRLSFAQEMKNGTSFGVGLGYNQAPLNMAIAGVAVAQLPVGATGGGANPDAAYALGVATYKDLSNFAADLSAVFKSFQVNLGYQYQDMKKDKSIVNAATTGVTGSGGTAPAATLYNFMDQKGSATAFWVELGYLVMGDSYKFCSKNAVVSGVKLREKQAGFEITGRYGVENRKNMLALLTPTGWSDFNTYADGSTDAGSARARADIVGVHGQPTNAALMITVDNTQAVNATPAAELGRIERDADKDFFETKMTGFAISLNYYMAENAVLKLEYENRHNEFKRPNKLASAGEIQTGWRDSAFNKNVGTLRLRADYSF